MSFERSNIEKMEGYAPGEQTGKADTIKLNTNENPYPPSPEVSTALQSISIDRLRRYPSPMADDFRKRAAKLHGVGIENILPTNGGDELLRLLMTTFVETQQTIAITRPSYSLYPVLAKIHGCKLLEIPLLEDWSMPVDFADTLLSSGAKMAILVNPHAPTGALLSTDYLSELADKFPGILVIDEAYVDFIDPELGYNSIPLIEKHENVLLARTLSKGYSLAGLRFGYGIASTTLIDPMMYKTRDSYNTDHISQQLGAAAISSVDYARQSWQRIRQERSRLSKELGKLGLSCLPSQSNFLLCQVPKLIDASALYQQLKERGILVRYFDQDRLRDKLRISIGSEPENTALLAALQEIIKQQESQRNHFCPSCKKPLRRIEGKMGPFWGCTGFPQCRATMNDLDGKPSNEVDEHYRCPVCTRRLVRADKEKGDYWFCSGYSKGCKVTLDDENGIPEAAWRCHQCGHLLAKREGKNGAFWGCSEYPECTVSYSDKDNRPVF